MDNHRVVGIIPARWNSTRFPGKMLFNVFGKTIIQHTWEQASKSKLLDKLVIATDDTRVFNECISFGAGVIITKKTCNNGTERCIEALSVLLDDWDIMVNIQGDEPNIDPNVIDKVIMEIKKNPTYTCCTPISKITEEEAQDPNVVKCVFNLNYEAMYFSRSPIPHGGPWWGHIGLYAYRTSRLYEIMDTNLTPLSHRENLEQLKILERGGRGGKIGVVPVKHKVIGIDVIEDIKKFIKHYLNIVK